MLLYTALFTVVGMTIVAFTFGVQYKVLETNPALQDLVTKGYPPLNVTGASGTSGSTGGIGVSGQPGITGGNGGMSGSTGADGGRTGAIGTSGGTGTTGSSGESGGPGTSGSSGSSGSTGTTGVSGNSGSTGTTGTSGIAGPTGGNGGVTGSTGAAGSQTSTILAPQITGMMFDNLHNVQINLTGSISTDPTLFQYVSIMRGLTIFSCDEIPDMQNLPLFSASRTVVTFSNLTLLSGDVIIHSYYTTNNVLAGSVVASVTKTYHAVCIVEMRNITIPYCWDIVSQNYCPVPPQIGITGQILTNASAYIAANVSSLLTLDQRSGCFFVILNSAIDRTLFRSMHGDIKTTRSGQGNCMKFSVNAAGVEEFVLPSFTCQQSNMCIYLSDNQVAYTTIYIRIESPRVTISPYEQLVEFGPKANAPPFVYSFNFLTYNFSTYVNVTICGYMDSWSFRQFQVQGTSNQYPLYLSTGIHDIFQWGDLGLTHLDLNYYNTLPQGYIFSDLSNILTVDQPSVDTLSSISNLQKLYYATGTNPSPMTNLAMKMSDWNMSKIFDFDFLYADAQIGDVNISSLSKWRLNTVNPSSFYFSFSQISANNIPGLDVSNWNPITSNLDYAFYNQNVVVPNITTWGLLRNVCANQAFSFCDLLTTVLYDALLIKFDAETESLSCVWSGIQANSTSISDAAVAGLCARSWTIYDFRGARCCGLVPC